MTVTSINASPSTAIADPSPDAFGRYCREYTALVDLAELVNCPNITLQPGGRPDDDSFEETFTRFTERLEQLSSIGGPRNISLSVEAHGGSILEKPADALRMAKRLWPRVGLTYDPSHFALQGIPLADTESLLDYIKHVHVRNASPDKMQDSMARGTVDFEWLIAALRGRDYAGAVTTEYISSTGDVNAVKDTVLLRSRLLELGVND